ncbi:hypothetical protein A0H81_13805 [Grifola frondosa]|uniref:F-box domain-containing protein n=1 Tax=Grifola frondosa TaxID=5627 RepID=A0A1C7LPQ2_GRIFR|nr:hypothetical protein A0H81_13805 [Grifola frondosa]
MEYRRLIPIPSLLYALRIIVRVQCGGHYHKTTVCAEISPQSLLRFRQYAARVRTITSVIDPNDYWLRHCPSYDDHGVIFPFLRSARIKFKAPVFSLLLSPSLRDVHIDFRSMYGPGCLIEVQSIVREICSAAPLLDSIKFTNSPPGALVSIATLDHLIKVDLPISATIVADLKLLRSLSAMETITSLSIQLDSKPKRGRVLSPRGFPALRELEVYGDLPDVTHLLSELASPHIHHVKVVSRSISLQLASKCLDTLRSRFSSLRSLHFFQFAGPGADMTPTTFIDCIGPVLQMPHLHKVFLEFPRWKFYCQPQDFLTMTQSWPDLRSLALEFTPVGQIYRFESIMDVAYLCPKLEHGFEIHISRRLYAIHGLRMLHFCRLLGIQSLEDGDSVHEFDPDSENFLTQIKLIDRTFPNMNPFYFRYGQLLTSQDGAESLAGFEYVYCLS